VRFVVTPVIALACFAIAAARPAQDSSDKLLKQRIIELLETGAESQGLGALASTIAFGDELFLARGVGYDAAGDPVGATTPFSAAALVDLLATAAVLQLAEAEKFALEDPIADVLEGWDAERQPCTIEQVLSHTSGLPGYADHLRIERGADRDPDLAAIAGWLSEQELETPPGKCFTYSESNVFVLARIVAQASGMDFAAYVDENVLAPCEIERGHADGDVTERSRRLGGELVTFGPTLDLGYENWTLDGYQANRLFQALIDGTLVSRKSFERMVTPARLSDGTLTGFGYGIGVSQLGDDPGYVFTGGANDSVLHLAYYPAFDLRVVLCSDGDGSADLGKLERSIARTLFDLSSPTIEDRPTSEEKRQRYIGTYFIGCEQITIGESDERLTLDGFRRPDWVLLYQGQDTFVVRGDPDVRINFEMDGERAFAFVLDERGIQSVATRVK